MRMMQSLSIKTTMPTADLISALKVNRARHIELHAEAVEGYLRVAKAKLETMLKELAEGKVSKVYIHLEAPRLHKSEYDTYIAMMEDNTAEEVTLSAAEYRTLVEDQWDWMDSWISSNSVYSPQLSAMHLEMPD
jgi:hypothetical protein